VKLIAGLGLKKKMIGALQWCGSALERADWQRSLKTALAAGICYALTSLLKMPEGFWASISSIVVMQSEVGATMRASRDRFFGTTIGALIGWLTGMMFGNNLYAFASAVLVAMMVCGLLGLQSASRLAGVAVAIILLAASSRNYGQLAMERFIEVNLGIVIALLVSLMLWPKKSDVSAP